MRLKITFEFEDPLRLPLYYAHMLQAMVYQMIDDDSLQTFLHDQGFTLGKRKFKPFVFSWLYGKFTKQDRTLFFYSPVSFFISSPWEKLMNCFCSTFVQRTHVELNRQKIRIANIEMLEEPEFAEETIVQTLTPITVYSTLETPDGRKVTHYYDMRDPMFSELIRQNLVKKALAILGEDLSDAPFEFKPMGKVDSRQQKTVFYKGFIIKGWQGRFCMKGDVRLQRIAYDLGVGSKNAQSFGMIEVRSQRR